MASPFPLMCPTLCSNQVECPYSSSICIIKKKKQPVQCATNINKKINFNIFIAPAYLNLAKNFSKRPIRNNRGSFNNLKMFLICFEEPSVSNNTKM